MTTFKTSNEDIDENGIGRDFALVLATSARRKQASQAGKLRAIYAQSPAQYLMRFQDFQKPTKRNKILQGLGLEPMNLPFDRRRANRSSFGRSR